MSIAKNWTFTCNNWTPEDRKKFEEFDCRYIIFGEEVGKEGTPHLQGYLQLHIKKRLSYLKKNLHSTAHFEAAIASYKANKDYCSKDATNIYERGTPSVAGKRNDIIDFRDAMRETKLKRREVLDNFPAMLAKYPKFVDICREEYHPEVTKPMYSNFDMDYIMDFSRVPILIGKPGSGKTSFAIAHFPDGCLLVRNLQDLTKFNPDHHTGIVFDDLSLHNIDRQDLISMLDWELPGSVRVLYGVINIPAHTKKIMCVNSLALYDEAIERRIQRIQIDHDLFFHHDLIRHTP